MKKKAIAGLLGTALLLGAAMPVFAEEAAAKTKEDISVYVEGEPVAFQVPPMLENGTTLVPFRAVFEALGMEVGWDGTTRTVTGSAEGLDVELQIDSKEAKVNGEAVALSLAPRIVGEGTTMIPLRFVSEAAGRDVQWDGYTKSIMIGSAEDNIEHVIRNHFEYAEAEDMEGVKSTLDLESPAAAMTVQVMTQLAAVYDLDYTIDELDMQDVKADSAAVLLTVTTSKKSGPELKDNQTTQLATFVKKNGSWLLSAGKPLKIDYMLEDQFADESPSVSDDVYQAVKQVFDQQIDLSVKEDFASLRKLYTADYPNLEQTMMQFQYVAASFDIEIDVIESSILQASDDKVVLKYTFEMDMTGPMEQKVRSTSVMTLKKQADGSWKIAADDTLVIEYLN